MQTPIQCLESMALDFLQTSLSAESFARKWQGAGGLRSQPGGRDFANVNPCPDFFANVLLFVPFREHDGGSLEFQLRPDASLTLKELSSKFGPHNPVVNGLSLGAQFFRFTRPELRFDAAILAEFENESPSGTDRPYLITVRREEK